jgi:hypothetical protein
LGISDSDSEVSCNFSLTVIRTLNIHILSYLVNAETTATLFWYTPVTTDPAFENDTVSGSVTETIVPIATGPSGIVTFSESYLEVVPGTTSGTHTVPETSFSEIC